MMQDNPNSAFRNPQVITEHALQSFTATGLSTTEGRRTVSFLPTVALYPLIEVGYGNARCRRPGRSMRGIRVSTIVLIEHKAYGKAA
jgi:hypothetical protein